MASRPLAKSVSDKQYWLPAPCPPPLAPESNVIDDPIYINRHRRLIFAGFVDKFQVIRVVQPVRQSGARGWCNSVRADSGDFAGILQGDIRGGSAAGQTKD